MVGASISDGSTPGDALAGGDPAKVLGNPTVLGILDELRSGPRTAAQLAGSGDLGAMQDQLDRLVGHGLVVADPPQLPTGAVTYRWDGGSLTGIRAWNRRLRRRPSGETGIGAAVASDEPASPPAPGPGAVPSVAAWTNPAVKAALRRLEQQAAASGRRDRTKGPRAGSS